MHFLFVHRRRYSRSTGHRTVKSLSSPGPYRRVDVSLSGDSDGPHRFRSASVCNGFTADRSTTRGLNNRV